LRFPLYSSYRSNRVAPSPSQPVYNVENYARVRIGGGVVGPGDGGGAAGGGVVVPGGGTGAAGVGIGAPRMWAPGAGFQAPPGAAPRPFPGATPSPRLQVGMVPFATETPGGALPGFFSPAMMRKGSADNLAGSTVSEGSQASPNGSGDGFPSSNSSGDSPRRITWADERGLDLEEVRGALC
jgi:hypothetical protein